MNRLPASDQQAVRQALARPPYLQSQPKRRRLARLPDGSFFNPAGLPNDDPVFQTLEQIEQERHRDPGPRALVLATGN